MKHHPKGAVFDPYQLVDLAVKVVGFGSVGTLCMGAEAVDRRRSLLRAIETCQRLGSLAYAD